jgi:cyclohexadieny/prephenate dehydrogenase / 3-phosphoshikimate 1-carboxyvinyltransferase
LSELPSKHIAIMGLGLIGGSIARGLKSVSKDVVISACDQNDAALQQALSEGVIDQINSLEALDRETDILVIALPPVTAAKLMPDIAAAAPENCVITDVASVKSTIMGAVNEQPESFQQRFVPGHPIAGSEQSEYQASKPDLFQDRNVILTPHANVSSEAVAEVHNLWRLLGANILGLELAKHDEILAATSHLPHLLAYAIVDVLVDQQQSEDIFRYAAGGFADFSRLASSNAKMWSDIFVSNSEAMVAVLDCYIDRLQEFKAHITNQEHSILMDKFSNAKDVRDNFLQKYFGSKVTTEQTESTIKFMLSPGGAVSGEIRVPGDKSISHRSIILGSIAEGVTKVSGFLEGEDALNTLAAFQEMGVTIVGPSQGELTIYGVGKNGLKAPRVPLNMGNSGTAMRLLSGLLAAQSFSSELTGDESLNQRPMARVIDPLSLMGAEIESSNDGTPPLLITGKNLQAIDYSMNIASAQVKSCVLLAGLYAEGRTTVTEPAPCRDHTERMLEGFGYSVEKQSNGSKTSIEGGGSLKGTAIDVPADISSAAFFLVAATITPGANLLLKHVGINPTRIGIINLLNAMGADIQIINESEVGGEPVADLKVSHADLQGIEISSDQIPLAIDEFPVLFVAAACAKGETILRGAEELRVKESDRLEAMAVGLKTLGVEVETYADGIRIVGGDISGGSIDSFGDHRIAMAFVIAGLRASEAIEISNCANVATSFPGFIELANSVGIPVRQVPEQA